MKLDLLREGKGARRTVGPHRFSIVELKEL